MAPDFQVRQPGANAPEAMRDVAAKAGKTRPDPLLLRRLRYALVRLPDSARGPYYFEIPGDCLASPRELQQT
jgi:hypothetical protein